MHSGYGKAAAEMAVQACYIHNRRRNRRELGIYG